MLWKEKTPLYFGSYSDLYSITKKNPLWMPHPPHWPCRSCVALRPFGVDAHFTYRSLRDLEREQSGWAIRKTGFPGFALLHPLLRSRCRKRVADRGMSTTPSRMAHLPLLGPHTNRAPLAEVMASVAVCWKSFYTSRESEGCEASSCFQRTLDALTEAEGSCPSG